MSVWNFEKLQKEIGGLAIRLDAETFYPQAAIDRLLDIMARSIPVDEHFYRTKYPDVRAATESGEIPSAARHFVDHGFYEDRMPCDIVIDETAYLARYPDIAEAIESGAIDSATDHWIRYGRVEERTAYLHLKRQDPKRGDRSRREPQVTRHAQAGDRSRNAKGNGAAGMGKRGVSASDSAEDHRESGH